MWWAGLAAAAGQELLRDEGPDPELQNQFIREQASTNAALQREFAQNGIRWRVEDAKAAGLHPMYALTGGGAAFSPNAIAIGGESAPQNTGQSFGGAMGAALAQFFKSQEQKDNVIAQAVQAVAAVAQSNSISAVPAPSDYRWDMDMSGGPMHADVNLQNAFDVQQYVPVSTLSRSNESPSLTPGVGPGGAVHNIAPGFNMILPSSAQGGTAEALESLSESRELTYAFIHRNVEQFGEAWLDQAAHYFPVTSAIYRVVQNIRNASSWVEPTYDALGHRANDWIRERYENVREIRGMRSKALNREGLPRTFWGTMPRR